MDPAPDPHAPALYTLVPARLPLLIDVPHAGTYLPPSLVTRLTPAARAVPDTDWHVDALYRFATELGAGLMCATHARYVIDLNRDPSGAALYQNTSNTELCPLRTFAEESIYLAGQEPTRAEIEARIATYYAPYHARLRAEVDALRARFGHVVLLDGHSIRAEVPRFFTGRLPDLNLGTADGTSCSPALAATACAVLQGAAGFTHVLNGRWKGGYVTRGYGRPGAGVHTLQLEMAQDCYMDEADPMRFDPARAAPLQAVLRALVEALLAWRP